MEILGGTHAFLSIFLLQSQQKGFPLNRCRNAVTLENSLIHFVPRTERSRSVLSAAEVYIKKPHLFASEALSCPKIGLHQKSLLSNYDHSQFFEVVLNRLF